MNFLQREQSSRRPVCWTEDVRGTLQQQRNGR